MISLERKTKETGISVNLNIKGKGNYKINVENQPFFQHMLEAFAKNAAFDIEITASGDLQHHIVEDCAIVLGQAFDKAIANKQNIARYGSFILAMGDALVLVSVDISGRPYFSVEYNYPNFKDCTIENFDLENIEEFMRAFANNAKITLQIKVLNGTNRHHIAEAIFKCLGRALRIAVSEDKVIEMPSTKGIL
ncbi:MAG: imidazoleglycerol-phosphate dehydratase HisB [Candidatus Diapherotrites archaeon CG08_land_8_20_14_0_20_34_12]|nr:MAG: imidazoleglycerol-phosphate dehydratase HisB [Candidatus Diapherotrites archaeon CG08_land_8_20_14_0_20_34_12]